MRDSGRLFFTTRYCRELFDPTLAKVIEGWDNIHTFLNTDLDLRGFFTQGTVVTPTFTTGIVVALLFDKFRTCQIPYQRADTWGLVRLDAGVRRAIVFVSLRVTRAAINYSPAHSAGLSHPANHARLLYSCRCSVDV